MAGMADSLIANIKTVAPGISPIPPVSKALKAPRIEKKFHFLALFQIHNAIGDRKQNSQKKYYGTNQGRIRR